MSLEQYQWDIENCNRCSMCKWVNPWEVTQSEFAKICPAVSRHLFDAYSAQGKIDIGMAILSGALDPKNEAKLPEIVYSCNLCGACDVMCKRARDIEPLLTLKALRERLRDLDLVPDSLKQVRKNVIDGGNVFAGASRGQWAENLDLRDAAADEVEVLLYTGCAFSSDPALAEKIQATAEVLQAAGVSFGVLGPNESCCGRPLADQGAAQLFEETAAANLELFNSTGVKQVITPCAECYSTIKVDYARVAFEQNLTIDYETLHVVEFMEGLLADGKIKPGKSLEMKVAYHDPCHLARLSDPFIPWKGTRGDYGACTPQKILRRGEDGCYDPPRKLVSSIPGVRLVEMTRSKENSWCCGAGGGVRQYDPEFARWTGEQRVDEALAAGAEALVSACPWCEVNLAEAAQGRLPVYDVAELLKMSQG